MIDAKYKAQVDLLLTILPQVAKEKSLALKGGAAINLFVREMPRLSVDIDLTLKELKGLAAVKWKLQNIQNAKAKDPEKHSNLYKTLQKKLNHDKT
jgi:hypothetical protein